jgi:hypothetical protein
MGADLNVIAREKQNWRPWWNLDVNVIVEKKDSTQKNCNAKMRRKKMQHKFYPKLCHRARERQTQRHREKIRHPSSFTPAPKTLLRQNPKKRKDKQTKQTNGELE